MSKLDSEHCASKAKIEASFPVKIILFIWQASRDSNSNLIVLETIVFPVKLLTYMAEETLFEKDTHNGAQRLAVSLGSIANLSSKLEEGGSSRNPYPFIGTTSFQD